MKYNLNYKLLKNLVEDPNNTQIKLKEVGKYTEIIQNALHEVLNQETLIKKIIHKNHSKLLSEEEMIYIWLKVLKKKFDLNIKNIDYTKFMVQCHLPGDPPKFIFNIESFYSYIKQFE